MFNIPSKIFNKYHNSYVTLILNDGNIPSFLFMQWLAEVNGGKIRYLRIMAQKRSDPL